MKGIVMRLAVVGVAVLLALVVVEQGLRLVGWEYKPLSVKVRDREDARGFHLFSDEHFVYDPRLLWRPKPGFGVFNSQGFRGPELTSEPAPREIRIIAVGDSNTLGWAGPDGANWPEFLAEIVGQGEKVSVVNAGVWGYSSAQGLARLEETLAYQPDLVLISFGSNDAHRVSRSDREFAKGSQTIRSLVRWLTHFRIGQLVASSLREEAAGEQLEHRVPLDKYRNNLRRMAEMARANWAQPVFMTRPFVGTINDPGVWKTYGFDYNAATVEVASDLQVPVIDLYTYFKGRDVLFSDESHFTVDGHREAASIVADHLRPTINSLEQAKTFRQRREEQRRRQEQRGRGASGRRG